MSAMDGLHTWDWLGITEEEYRQRVEDIQGTARKNHSYGSCLKCGREVKYSQFGFDLCRWCSAKRRKWLVKNLDSRTSENTQTHTPKVKNNAK